MSEFIKAEDIYDKNLNFLLGSGASFGLFPTLALQIVDETGSPWFPHLLWLQHRPRTIELCFQVSSCLRASASPQLRRLWFLRTHRFQVEDQNLRLSLAELIQF